MTVTDNIHVFIKRAKIANHIPMVPLMTNTLSKNTEFQCIAIKPNGKRCKQKNNPKQNGGPIIGNYCNYHCKLR